jgi:alkylation response protein AidB-like acyl-CoA dehydrogenase
MNLNQECIMLQTELKKFAQQVILDKVDESDKSCILPTQNIQQLGEMGILGAMIPENFNGAALELIGFIVSLEEISKVCTSTATVVAAHNAYFAFPIATNGSDILKNKYLPKAATGELIGGHALYQTNEVTVEKQGDNFLINGRNPFVLNGESSGPLLMFANTGNQPTDITAFLIDADTENLKRTKTSSILGLRAAGISEITLDNVVLTPENILGDENKGYDTMQDTNDIAKVCLAAIALGVSQGALNESIAYAKERIQFNQAIINFGMVREKLALMATHIEASRHLTYEAALLFDAKKNLSKAAAMAKYFSGQTAVETTTQAIQIFGGYGYMKDYPIERYFRDAQVITVMCNNPADEKEFITKETI